MSTLTESELKRLIATLEKRNPTSNLALQFPHGKQIGAQRRRLAKRLEPYFVNAGLDVDGIKKVLADDQNERRRILTKPSSEAKKGIADVQKGFRRSIANRRKALDYLAGRPIQLINYITLDTPFYLWTHDAGILVDSHIEPWNNWAKIYWDITSDSDTDHVGYYEELRFYFLWNNPSDSMVVININSSLMLQGHVSMGGSEGYFSSGAAALSGAVFLNANQWGGTPPSSPPPADASTGYGIVSKVIFGSDLFNDQTPGGTFDLGNEYDLHINYFAVPAHANVVFQVSTSWTSQIWNGGVILVDFKYNNTDNKIICPAVQLELYGPAQG